ncbi:MAG: helix-turn-helix domain-containing protein [Saprospiraceae bacterium]
MKSQNTHKRHSIVFQKIIWRFPKALSLLVMSKFALLIFLLFIASAFDFQVDSLNTDKNELTIHNIRSNKDPNLRALNWYLYIYKISSIAPHQVAEQLEIAKSLWSDDYRNKSATLLMTQAEVNSINGKHKEASDAALEVIKLLEGIPSKTLNEKKLVPFAYITFAGYSKYTQEKEGLSFAYKALEIATAIDFPTGQAIAHNQIGLLIHYFNRDAQLALEHFNKGKDLIPLVHPEIAELLSSYLYGNIALCWSDLGDIEKSINYKLQLLAKNINYAEILIVNHNNLGTDYYTLKQYDLAEKYLQKTLDLMDEHQTFINQGIPLLRMGLIQLEKNQLVKAESYAHTIDNWLISHQFVGDYKVLFYQFKSKIAKTANDYEQAIHWLEQASLEQASINQIAISRNLVKLEEKEKLRNINQELQLLAKEKALNQATINMQRIFLSGIFLITVLSIWFGISFYEKTKELKEAYNFILRKNSALSSVKIIAEKAKNDSSIPEKTIDEALKEKIKHAIEDEKVFLSPDLTLKKFADQLSSNTSYVSQTINEGFGKNFSTFINEHRIKAVIQFFKQGQHQQFTIEALYKKAGFKSKSAFQKAFKSSTGVTASYYLEHLSQFSNSNEHPK